MPRTADRNAGSIRYELLPARLSNMLTFIANWFRPAGRAEKSAAEVAAPDTSIQYKPALVDELQA